MILPRDSHVTKPREIKRLAGQNLDLFQRLQAGPLTNREMVALYLKYTSRVSDLRSYFKQPGPWHGYDVVALERDGGLTTYHLVPPPLVVRVDTESGQRSFL